LDIARRRELAKLRRFGQPARDRLCVGRRIREMRGFDLTQAELPERIGISQNYLSTMERGKVEIGAAILLRIGREFGKSVEWLLTGKSSVSDLATVDRGECRIPWRIEQWSADYCSRGSPDCLSYALSSVSRHEVPKTQKLKIMMKSAWGSDDPTRASFAFIHGLALAEAGHDVQIFLTGEATYTMRKATVDAIKPVTCSTFDRTVDFVRFFARSTSSTRSL
jgi:transcriptional regulator with XRE-family HTH domain